MSKIFAAILALVLALSLCAVAEEPVTITAMSTYRNETHTLTESLPIATTLEAAGIRLELTSISKEAWSEQYRLTLGGGNYPGVIFGHIDAEWYGTQEGILLPLEGLFKEYAPNICAQLDKFNGWDKMTYSDGHIYSLPSISPSTPRDQMLWVNKVWMNNLELEMPRSMEDIYEVLKAFKENDANGNGDENDEIPLVCYDTQGNGCSFMCFANYLPYMFNLEFRLVIGEDGNVGFLPMTQEFYDLVEYCTTLYSEGLMNEDAFTMTVDDQAALVSSTDTVGMIFASDPIYACGVDKVFDWEMIQPWCPSVEVGGFVGRDNLCLTDHCEDPEAVIAWLDTFYTEEGATLAALGVEGVTYTIDENGNWSWLENEEQDAYYIRNVLVSGFTYGWSDFYEFNDAGEDMVDKYVKKQKADAALMYNLVAPQLPFTDDDLQIGLPVMIDVNGYFPQYMSQVMTGALDLDASWADFQAELLSMNAPVLEEVLQGCYDRMEK